MDVEQIKSFVLGLIQSKEGVKPTGFKKEKELFVSKYNKDGKEFLICYVDKLSLLKSFEYRYLFCDYSLKNLEELERNWDSYSKNKDLIVYFVSQGFEYFCLKPFAMSLVTDKDNLGKSLRSLYSKSE